ncbi:MAG: DUF2062 domain-containing protein [Bryobacteraceae bacterium]
MEKRNRLARALRQARSLVSGLMQEGLAPRRAAAAVFLGVFIGVVPIYGFQMLVALGLATVFRLNRPLTFAATFVNNPFFQPWLIVSSLEIGHRMLEGRWLRLALADLSPHRAALELHFWLLGSLVLAALLGSLAALVAYIAFRVGQARRADPVGEMFRAAGRYDRGFIRWKLRLDKIFDILRNELAPGPVVDLGCGYGIALALAELREPGRRLCGCDLDPHRIEVARRALGPSGAELAVADIREFRFEPAAIILILDVLQYLTPEEQREVIENCCASLLPGGKFLFRIPDCRRGAPSWMSLALDKLVFRFTGCRDKPTVLPAGAYRAILTDAGMEVRELAVMNRLPLAHIVFIGSRSAA